MKLNNVRLLVEDFEKSFHFYNEILGLKCTWGDKNDVYASFDIGLPSGLAIFKKQLMAEATGTKISPDSYSRSDDFVVVIEVDDVDQQFEMLKTKSLTFLTNPRDMKEWGIRVVHLRDNEGNLLELMSNLKE